MTSANTIRPNGSSTFEIRMQKRNCLIAFVIRQIPTVCHRHEQIAHRFDAPILQVMYLDKPMKDHNLLQAICRTNRTFGQEKTHGLIVDYIAFSMMWPVRSILMKRPSSRSYRTSTTCGKHCL